MQQTCIARLLAGRESGKGREAKREIDDAIHATFVAGKRLAGMRIILVMNFLEYSVFVIASYLFHIQLWFH
jgi:hypothetical protein